MAEQKHVFKYVARDGTEFDFDYTKYVNMDLAISPTSVGYLYMKSVKDFHKANILINTLTFDLEVADDIRKAKINSLKKAKGADMERDIGKKAMGTVKNIDAWLADNCAKEMAEYNKSYREIYDKWYELDQVIATMRRFRQGLMQYLKSYAQCGKLEDYSMVERVDESIS